jgi:tripartite-type tricarboxylate transporter receptor subunit TctC
MRYVTALSVAFAFIVAGPATAEDYPARVIHLVVPYPAGGNVDSAARIVADKMQAKLGQPILIDNRAGAGGMIAGEYVAKSEKDGYTLFVGANGPVLFAPIINKREAYNWKKDFIPITTISMTAIVLETNPLMPARTVKELFDLARKDPGKLTMASPGAGTSNHLLSELAQSELGLHWVTVHYRGNAPATNDLLGGQVQFAFDQMSVALPYIVSGKLRALAVTSLKRLPWLPDVPTFAELGYKDFDAQTFTGLFAPAGTPEVVVKKLHDTMADVLKDPDVVDKFNKLGAEATTMTSAEFSTYLEHEDAKWIPIIRKVDIGAN